MNKGRTQVLCFISFRHPDMRAFDSSSEESMSLQLSRYTLRLTNMCVSFLTQVDV